MRIGDQRRNPARVDVALAYARAAVPALAHIALHGRLPEALVAAVDRQFASVFGHPDRLVRQHEFAAFAAQREAMRAAPDGDDEERRRSIERVAGCKLL